MDAAAKQRAQNTFARRVRAVLAVDDLVGRVEAELRKLGIARKTYLVISSDNGYHIGDYRLPQGNQTAFDTDIRVPLVVAGPSIPAGRTDNRLVSSIDLAPTFESIAGITPPATVDGVSALPVLRGQKGFAWQQAVLVEHHNASTDQGDPDKQDVDPPDYEAVRTRHGLFVQYAGGEREYYDTDKDPWELHNRPGSVPPSIRTQLRVLEGCGGASACQAAAGA